LPFWFAAGLSLLNALYGLFVLPESLPEERRQKTILWWNANPVGALAFLRSRGALIGLATVNFLGYVAHEVYATVYVLYVTYRYHWTQRTVGNSLALVGICSMIVSGAVVGPVVKGVGGRRTPSAGLLLGALRFARFGRASTTALFLVAVPINTLWGLAGPASQSMMTQQVSPTEQGELQGAIGSVRSLAMLFGPGLFAFTFATFI